LVIDTPNSPWDFGAALKYIGSLTSHRVRYQITALPRLSSKGLVSEDSCRPAQETRPARNRFDDHDRFNRFGAGLQSGESRRVTAEHPLQISTQRCSVADHAANLSLASGLPPARRRSEKNDKLVEDYLASKAAFKDYQPIVVDADFQITFFFDHGKPASAGDLNGALTLVLSRYDLNLGRWDLARDAGLRESLLSPKTVQKVPATSSA
jgi:hypothetical protein